MILIELVMIRTDRETAIKKYLISHAAFLKLTFLLITLALILPTSAFCDIKSHKKLFEYQLIEDNRDIFWQVAERLNKTDQIVANFKQEKTITVLKKPLHSTGLMLFSVKNGLCWETATPFYSMLIISNDGIRQKDAEGSSRSIMPDQNRAAIKLSEVFLAVFLGQRDILEENFYLYFLGDLNSWQIGLKPRDRTVQHFLQSIALKGTTTVTGLEILEENGDFTAMQLTPQELVNNALTQQKQKCFD